MHGKITRFENENLNLTAVIIISDWSSRGEDFKRGDGGMQLLQNKKRHNDDTVVCS